MSILYVRCSLKTKRQARPRRPSSAATLLVPLGLDDVGAAETLRKEGMRALAIVFRMRCTGVRFNNVFLSDGIIKTREGPGHLGTSKSCFSIKGSPSSLPAAVSSSESKECRMSLVKEGASQLIFQRRKCHYFRDRLRVSWSIEQRLKE